MDSVNNCAETGPLLLKTDQERCYNETGVEIPCAGSGQDGAGGLEPETPEKRFAVREGVVADRLTGLVWSLNAAPAVFPMSWPEAFDYVKGLNVSAHLGIDRWRLPSRRELYSLVSHRLINPALPQGHPFTDVFSGYYWTATPASRLADQAWYVHLGGGRIYRGMKAGSYMVWPVTGPQGDGESFPERFTFENDVLHDRAAGRMWLGAGPEANRSVTWPGALETITGLNSRRAGGYGDWRLPNIRELDSLVNLDGHSPALPEAAIRSNVAEGYWSATTSAYEKRYAWVLYTRDGAIGVGFKTQPDFCVWAVRPA